jgi:hypothetical protein
VKKRVVELAHVISLFGIDKFCLLATIDNLTKHAMEKGVVDTELANHPVEGEHDGEYDANRGQFDNRIKRLVKVGDVLLREAIIVVS